MKFLLSLFFGLAMTAAANACTAPPPICNDTTGLFNPGPPGTGLIYEYGGTAGPAYLTPVSQPNWYWANNGSSYTFIYTAPIFGPSGNRSNLTGHTFVYNWNWHAPYDASPVSGGGVEVQVHCFFAGNDGQIWYYTGPQPSTGQLSTLAYYNTIDGVNSGDSTISCPFPAGGSDAWFNQYGQNALNDLSEYTSILTNINDMFGMGLVFGDSSCSPNWYGNGGSVTCWEDGAYGYTAAGPTEFFITSSGWSQ